MNGWERDEFLWIKIFSNNAHDTLHKRRTWLRAEQNSTCLLVMDLACEDHLLHIVIFFEIHVKFCVKFFFCSLNNFLSFYYAKSVSKAQMTSIDLSKRRRIKFHDFIIVRKQKILIIQEAFPQSILVFLKKIEKPKN